MGRQSRRNCPRWGRFSPDAPSPTGSSRTLAGPGAPPSRELIQLRPGRRRVGATGLARVRPRIRGMSYVVLARTGRRISARWSARRSQALSNALAMQRLHHAYRFTGIARVQDHRVARILAKSLNPPGAGRVWYHATPCDSVRGLHRDRRGPLRGLH